MRGLKLDRARTSRFEPTIVEHDGRLVDTAGDGFLAVFDSPVEAVRCGIVIQQSMVARNAMLAREHWIEYRIEINLGDVLFEEGSVYGDGVNVAARLEGIAEPGQIYISGGIYEQVKHKVVCGYKSLGDRQVKNITDPVKVYRVLPDPSALIESRSDHGSPCSLRLLRWLWLFWREVALLGTCSLCGGAGKLRGGPQVATPTEMANGTPLAARLPPTASAGPSTRAAGGTDCAGSCAGRAAGSPHVTAAAPPLQQQSPLPRSVREPEMVSVPGGTFAMGSNDDVTEKPIHQVAIKPFAIGKFPVTVREWNRMCRREGLRIHCCGHDDAPVTDVNWNDAKQYVAWLAQTTGKPYRLPSEAEWEYAARGGKQTKYWWGDQFQSGMVNCKNCADVAGAPQPIKVGSLKPNPFGLYDMGGSVDQWVEDCWHKTYQGAPSDGSAWLAGDCNSRVIQSGSWRNDAVSARPASRDRYEAMVRYPTHGFRIALTP